MKTHRLMPSLVATTVLFFGLAILASKVPVSMANDVDESAAGQESNTHSGLLVEITHVRNDTGKVVVLVFDDADAYTQYDYERAVDYAEIDAQTGTLRTLFPELRAGPYAVTLFHDENADYDLNMDGIYPLEGYGTSGAMNPAHEPTFEEASVDSGRIAVRMYYLN